MSICPNCGRELAEGEICACTTQPVEQVTPQPEYTAPQPEAAPQQEYYAPQPDYSAPQQGYYDPQQQQQYNATYYAAPAPIPVAPAKPKARTDYPEGYKIKKKYVAVLLGYFLGTFGAHNFYLGNKNKALAQILLTTVGSIFTFGLSAFGVAIWSIIETSLILAEETDADAFGFKIKTLEELLKD